MVLVQKWPFYHFSFFNEDRPGKCVLRQSRPEKIPFQAIKTRSSKSSKIEIFPKRLTHGFGPKMIIFSFFFFYATQARKMCFTIFQNEKTPFQAIKTRISKSPKIETFPKGLTHGFGPKMPISKSPKIEIFPKGLTHGFAPKMPLFQFFFLGNIGRENLFYDILERENVFLGYKNNKFKKSKN